MGIGGGKKREKKRKHNMKSFARTISFHVNIPPAQRLMGTGSVNLQLISSNKNFLKDVVKNFCQKNRSKNWKKSKFHVPGRVHGLEKKRK